ncbi:low temperature requirement protein A [Micromonospora sp. NPDC050495]|uniref:low temperature requirement protein A n=1 Tax=Micromonospora sp. NPDC050495 TaxID=3154936 RepID=UPI0033DF9F0F
MTGDDRGCPAAPRPWAAPRDRAVRPFEIFFDLVFVFTLTRIMVLIGRPPTASAMGQGLLLLVLLWLAWSSFTWLGNQTPADLGVVRAGFLVAMAALFVAALVMPQAWTPAPGLDGPLLVALAYVLLRAVHLALYHRAAGDLPGLRQRIRFFAVISAVSWLPLLLGALLGGAAHTTLWVLAFLVEIGGQRLSYATRGAWPLRAPNYFAERHGLVLIIALGESLVAAGLGAGPAATAPAVLGVALLGLTTTVCLWWLYFDQTAPTARLVLARAPEDRRDRIAADAYSQTHLLLIVGVIYLALGVEQVLGHVAEEHSAPLGWPGAVALYGGAGTYLAGRLLLGRLTGQAVRPAAAVLAVAVPLLLPLGRALPPAAALGLLTALLLAATVADRLTRSRHPAAGADPAGFPTGPA